MVGRRRGEESGCSTKNKNPARQCGEIDYYCQKDWLKQISVGCNNKINSFEQILTSIFDCSTQLVVNLSIVTT